MRYPITKFVEGHGQWWYVNAVFNESPKEKKSHGVRSGERDGQWSRWLSPFAARSIQHRWRTLLRSTRTFLWKIGVLGASCARVRWEINFLLTFETAPFFCVYPVYFPRWPIQYFCCNLTAQDPTQWKAMLHFTSFFCFTRFKALLTDSFFFCYIYFYGLFPAFVRVILIWIWGECFVEAIINYTTISIKRKSLVCWCAKGKETKCTFRHRTRGKFGLYSCVQLNFESDEIDRHSCHATRDVTTDSSVVTALLFRLSKLHKIYLHISYPSLCPVSS